MFDINAAIGHWPFRKIPNQNADALRELLTQHDITGAAVVNTHGLFYKNCHDANLELAEQIATHTDFFTGIATLNPRYAAWERDLAACKDELNLRGLRLAPQYHGYQLGDPEALAIATAATQLDLPLFVPQRVVDLRQRHRLDADRMVDLDEVGALLGKVPGARIVLTEGSVSHTALVNGDGTPKYPGLHVEMSRLRSAYGQALAALAKAIGSDHVLFGTGAPLKSVSPALLKLQNADLDDEAREQIAETNARKLLQV